MQLLFRGIALWLVAATLFASGPARADESKLLSSYKEELSSFEQEEKWTDKGESTWRYDGGTWSEVEGEPAADAASSQPASDWKSSVYVELYRDRETWNDAYFSLDEGDATLNVLGVKGTQYSEARLAADSKDLKDTGLDLLGSLSGTAYLVEGRYVDSSSVGDDTLGLAGAISLIGMAGSEAGARSSAEIDRSHAEASGKLKLFMGVKATASLPLTVSLCYMTAMARLGGSVSAGVGGLIRGSFDIDWKTLTADLSWGGEATLGAGGGTYGEIRINLSQLVRDSASVLDCLDEKLDALAAAAAELGESLADSASRWLDRMGADLSSALAAGRAEFVEPVDELATRLLEAVECSLFCP